MEEENQDFTGCLSCLNDGYSRKTNYLIVFLALILVAVGATISYRIQPALGIPLIVLALLFAGSWCVFDHLNRTETAPPSQKELTGKDKNE